MFKVFDMPYKCLVVFIILTFNFSNPSKAQTSDTLDVQMNANQFLQGDTLNFGVELKDYINVAKAASIHLWIEELNTGRKWHYRYPLINGYINAFLTLDNQLNDGVYAFNFLLQKKFFNLFGLVKNAEKNEEALNYIILTKNLQSVSGSVKLNEIKSFSTGNLLFTDSAYIIFSRLKHNYNKLQLEIQTPLDSFFKPSAMVTKFVKIGKTIDSSKRFNPDIMPKYVFNAEDTMYKTVLQEVVVTAKAKKLADKFLEENGSGMFNGADAIVLDGLESDEIANSTNLYNYLSSQVGGLNVAYDEEGTRKFMWRKHTTQIYIDEIKVDPSLFDDINPSDVALIKIYRPGVTVSFGSASGGTIAIYMKKGAYSKPKKISNNFYISGYSGLETIWKQ